MSAEKIWMLVQQGFIDTLYMTVPSTLLAYIVGLPLGVQASRLANVPSNAKKIRLMALLFTFCACALVGIAFALGNPTPLQMAALVLTAVIGVAMLVFSHTLVKAQERV